MPRYNGPIAYPLEVFAHLLWAYVLFGAVFALLALPFVIFAAFDGHAVDAIEGFGSIVIHGPVFFLAGLHMMLCASSWFALTPRFPYAPAWLTSVLSSIFGASILTVATAVQVNTDVASRFGSEAEAAGIVWLLYFALSIFTTLFGLAMRASGAIAPGVSFKFPWFGRLLVGREAYDAFLASEESRLHNEYEEYRQSLKT